MASQRVLITGGCGFIGTHLCHATRAEGWDVSVLDLKVPTAPVEGVHYHRGDVLEDDLLFHLIEKVDHVVHLAAKVSVPLCELDPVGSYETNFLGTVKVAEMVSRVNRAQRSSQAKIAMYFASSAAVYGAEGRLNQLLTEPMANSAPLSHYAHQKRMSETALKLYRENVPSWSFRFFNVYGDGQDPSSPYSGVISIFKRKLLQGQSLDLYGDGLQTRDFISVQDVVSGILLAMQAPSERKQGDAINFCTGQRVTIRALGELLSHLSGLELHWADKPARRGDISHSCGDPSLAERMLGWKAKTALEAGLRALLKSEIS